jgi:hypothetical protein
VLATENLKQSLNNDTMTSDEGETRFRFDLMFSCDLSSYELPDSGFKFTILAKEIHPFFGEAGHAASRSASFCSDQLDA